jgi:hypothetical protein
MGFADDRTVIAVLGETRRKERTMPHEIVKLWLESRAGEDEGRGLSAPRKIWNPRRKSAVAGALLVP